MSCPLCADPKPRVSESSRSKPTATSEPKPTTTSEPGSEVEDLEALQADLIEGGKQRIKERNIRRSVEKQRARAAAQRAKTELNKELASVRVTAGEAQTILESTTAEQVAWTNIGPVARESMKLERRTLAASLLDAGASTEQIVKAFLDRYHRQDPVWVRKVAIQYTKEAREARIEEFRIARGAYKAEQVARLRSDLLRMRSMDRKPWSSIAKHEELLARITGTLEPIGVSVTAAVAVQESLVAVIGRMDPATIDAVVSEQVAIEAAARRAGYVPRNRLIQAGGQMDDRSSIRGEVDAEAESGGVELGGIDNLSN